MELDIENNSDRFYRSNSILNFLIFDNRISKPLMINERRNSFAGSVASKNLCSFLTKRDLNMFVMFITKVKRGLLFLSFFNDH